MTYRVWAFGEQHDADTIDEAARLFCQVRDLGGYGASDLRMNCGKIVDKSTGRAVANVRYNGIVDHLTTKLGN